MGFADSSFGSETVVETEVEQACKVCWWWKVNAEFVAGRLGSAVQKWEDKSRREYNRHTVVMALAVVRYGSKLVDDLSLKLPVKEG